MRRKLGYDDVVDYHSGAYTGGQIAGTGVNLGLAFANPCALSGSLSTGVRVINGIQAIGGSLNAGDNLAAGNYGAAALDLVGVAGNSFQMLRPCFPGEVQVLTRRGWVRWDALTTNDEVLSLPEQEPEGELAYRPVEEVFRRWGVIWEVTIAGRVLRTTAEHLFWVRGRGWTAAKDLQVGDELRSHDGRWLAVEGVRDTGREEVVYNCRVAEYHTYFVGDAKWAWSVWAHNSYTPPSNAPQGPVPRLGPHGVDPAHHNANIMVRDAAGQLRHHERIVSGNMTPAEQALGFPRNTLASHTEARAIRNIPLQQGETMIITGQKPPCPTCKGVMNQAVRDSGATIIYRWRENGVTRTWTAGN